MPRICVVDTNVAVTANETNHMSVECAVACQKALVALMDSGQPSFKEFPKAKALARFDSSDRVFVAVAAVCAGSPPILQAADSKWLGLWDVALTNAGINVEYLCKQELQGIFDTKFKT